LPLACPIRRPGLAAVNHLTHSGWQPDPIRVMSLAWAGFKPRSMYSSGYPQVMSQHPVPARDAGQWGALRRRAAASGAARGLGSVTELHGERRGKWLRAVADADPP
jgi:hypothetical protein